MNCTSVAVALVALCLHIIGATQAETPGSSEVQKEVKSTSALLAAVDKMLIELEERRESLKQLTNDIIDEDRTYPTSCLIGGKHNETSVIRVPGHGTLTVLCDSELAGLGWMVIQRRQDGLTNFYRDWSEYKAGFGELRGDFFIGLDRLHALTSSQPFELYIYMESFQGDKKFAKYDEFGIGNETEAFSLKILGGYTGTAGDSLTYHKGNKFSTFDRDNDSANNMNCAQYHLAGWWFKNCIQSNLNAPYLDYQYNVIQVPLDRTRYISWNSFYGSKMELPLKSVQMMIRPKFLCQ
ncbi:angiopoietin-related protein 7-like [Drosophila obscura]|uniref:angiopoietin-related protein 7-like n=1 Tax=Drosophila obscura TaxID=7282 RepID=UPI001BB29EF6|nr:angiopoietin-related protein 7-like [Drosophila obscura]